MPIISLILLQSLVEKLPLDPRPLFHNPKIPIQGKVFQNNRHEKVRKTTQITTLGQVLHSYTGINN